MEHGIRKRQPDFQLGTTAKRRSKKIEKHESVLGILLLESIKDPVRLELEVWVFPQFRGSRSFIRIPATGVNTTFRCSNTALTLQNTSV